MPNNDGTLIIAQIKPFSQDDSFPVQDQNDIKGGYHIVDTLIERDNLFEERKTVGMLIYVKETNTIYKLTEIPDPENPEISNIGWVPLETGGSTEGLTKDEADLYYATISHRHDSLYQLISHNHDWEDINKNLSNKIIGSKLSDISDVPDYQGNENKFLRAKSDQSGVEFGEVLLSIQDLSDAQTNLYEKSGEINVNANKPLVISPDRDGFQVYDIDLSDIQNDLQTNYGINPSTILTTTHYNTQLGVAQLDSTSKIPISLLPTSVVSNQIKVVDTFSSLSAISSPNEGMQQYVVDTDKNYIYSGDTWVERTLNLSVVMDWSNITGRPSSSALNIDNSVTNSHNHDNKILLDSMTQAYTVEQKNKLSTIDESAINKQKADTYYRSVTWKPNILGNEINNVELLNNKNGQVLTYDSLSGKYINKYINELDLSQPISEQIYSQNSGKLNNKQDTYFQKKIYTQSTNPQTVPGLILSENDIWINTENNTIQIYKGSTWNLLTSSQSSELSGLIDNNTLIIENDILKVDPTKLLLYKTNIQDFQHNHVLSDITIPQDMLFVSQDEKNTWNNKLSSITINDLTETVDKQFASQTEKDLWNNKQDKNSTLQINLNSEMLNGQKLNDLQDASNNVIWSSEKIQNQIQSYSQGIIPKESVTDIISDSASQTLEEGISYIIVNGVNDFYGHDNEIQKYISSQWTFTIPENNELHYVSNLNSTYIYSNSSWLKFLQNSNNHNDLMNIQGGIIGEKYHISENSYIWLNDKINNNISPDLINVNENKQFVTSDEKILWNNKIGVNDIDNLNQTVDKQFVSQTEKDFWNSGQNQKIELQDDSPLYKDINDKLNIKIQSETETGIMTALDKTKLNKVDMTASQEGSLLIYNATTKKYEAKLPSEVTSLTNNFIALNDTPDSYVNSDNMFPYVDEQSESMKFKNIKLIDISDYPQSITPTDLSQMKTNSHSHSSTTFSVLNDLTNNWYASKDKLQTISENANNYIHPLNHPASMIQQSEDLNFVSLSEKNTWNQKQNALGFIPENSQNKGVAGGYQSLTSQGLIPISQIPLSIKETLTVQDIQQRDQITDLYDGKRVFVIDASQDPNVTSGGKEYIYSTNSSSWIIIEYSFNITTDYNDLINKPISSTSDIDDQVSKKHSHVSSLTDIDDQVSKKHSHTNLNSLETYPNPSSLVNKVLKIDNNGIVNWANDGLGNLSVDFSNIQDGYMLIYDLSENKMKFDSVKSTWELIDKTNSKLSDISDVPPYAGNEGYFLRVNSTGTQIEYTNNLDGGEW